MVATYRVFLSSPSDVDVERAVVREVIDRLNQKRGEAPYFELFRWEEEFYTADQTFQDQVISPAQCDLVVCIFWKRLGTDLPPKYHRPDGTVPTGSEYEFEVALQAAASTDPKIPDVLVYRKTAPVQFSEETLEFEKAQRDRFLLFWRRWFHSEKGHFVAAFHSFADPGEFEQILEKHLVGWLTRRSGTVVWTQGSPYRGLRPYDFEHAPIFFGRTREVERTRARLIACAIAGPPFLMILGPSGSGKSSLVRAGVLPRLAAPGAVSGIADRVCHTIFTPDEIHDGGTTGLWALGLARCLFRDEALGPELRGGDFDRPEALATLFEQGDGLAAAPLTKALLRAETRLGPGAGLACSVALVVTVDQFEQVFWWPKDEAEAFVEAIASLLAATQGTNRILGLATMRSDYQHRIADLPALERLVGRRELRGPEDAERTIEITPPGHADLRDIIVRPARAAGLELETDPATGESLQHRIEAEARPDALPALQYLLSELYRLRDGNRLTLKAHTDLGGVAGVMATRGETVLVEAGPEVANALPRVLRALVAYDADDGQPTSRAVGADAFRDGSAEAALVDTLVEASLITSDRGVLRIAHESLLTGWRRLSTQIEKEKRFLETRERLAQLHRRYAAGQGSEWKRRKLLLEGFPLAEGRELLSAWGEESVADLDPTLPKFIERSIAADWWRRFGRLAMVVVATGAILFVGTTANRYREDALRAADEAEIRLELAKSEASLRQRDWDGAVEAGLRSYKKRDSAETRSAVLSALIAASPYLESTYLTDASALGWTTDRWLLLGSPTENRRVDTIKGGAVRVPSVAAENARTVAIASAGPDRLVLLDAHGRLTMVAGTNGADVRASELPGSALSLTRAHHHDWHVSISRVVVAMADGFEAVWLRECVIDAGIACTGAPIKVGQASAVALAPEGSQIAVATLQDSHRDVAIYALDKPDGPPVALFKIPGGPDDEILSLAWSPGGPQLAVGRRGGALAVIDVDHGDVREVASAGVPVLITRWSADGHELAYSCGGYAICVLGFDANGKAVQRMRFSGHRDTVTDFAFSPVDGALASRSEDGTVRIWNDRESDLALSTLHFDRQADFRFVDADPLTRRISAGDAGGFLWIWKPDSKPAKLPPPRPGVGAIVSLATAADGAEAAAYQHGLAIWSNPQGSDAPVVVPLDFDVRQVTWLGNGTEVAATTERGEVMLVARDGTSRRIPRFRERAWADGVVAIGSEDLVLSHTNGGALGRWRGREARWETVASESIVADRLSALSLSVHPDCRWLVATRADDRLKIYDLSGQVEPVSVNLLRPNTKTVAFSPDGSLLAALDSEGRIYLWDFDAATGTATLKATASDLPLPADDAGRPNEARSVSWIAWADPRRLAIATPLGEILLLTVGEAEWVARAEALLPTRP